MLEEIKNLENKMELEHTLPAGKKESDMYTKREAYAKVVQPKIMLEEIKKEFYETFPQNRFVGYTSNIIWPFIEQKLTEAIKQAKIEENEMWLAHANRFSNDVPNSLKRINRSELKDRINELKGE